MNRLVFGTLVLAVSLQAAVAANGFYVGGEIQLNKVQVDGGELGGGLSVGDFEGDQVGFDIFAGYRFHDTGNLLDYIAIEVAYQDLGEIRDTVSVTTDIQPAAKLELDGYTVEVLGFLPIVEDIEFFFKAGYFDFDEDISISLSGIGASGSDDDNGLTLGVGMVTDVRDNVSVRLGFNWFDYDDSLWNIGFGAFYSFGGSN